MNDARGALDAHAIAAHFDLGDDARIRGPVARGEFGEVWRLDTARGAFAVKRPFDAPEPDDVDADVAYQLAALAAGVPMPAPCRTTDLRALATVDGVAVRVYTWVDLDAPTRALDPALVGATVAQVHRVRHAGASGLHPWYFAPVGERAWDDLIGALGAAGAPFAASLAALRDELVALEELLAPPVDVQTCHRDLFADNVLATPDGGVCVIDWENSGRADPAQELAMVLFEFAIGDAARARALHDAYRAAGGPARVRRPADFSMIVAIQGHLAELASQRWLDPARRRERSHQEARMDELLGDP